MSRELDTVIAALLHATDAPGAAPKLEQLELSPDGARQIIRHLTQIPAFKRNFVEQMDRGPVPDVVDLDRERLVFLHIPKCGGTTLHDMLVDWYGQPNMHPERHNGLYYYSARDLASKTLFSGHYDYYSTQLIPGATRLITFLRDPRSRLVSLYHFHRSHRDELIERYGLTLARWANQYDIDEYFANEQVRAHPAINNSIARHLSNQPQLGRAAGNVNAGGIPVEVLREQAIANLARFDFVGLMEDYEASIARLTGLLDKPAPEQIKRARGFETLIETDPNMKKIDKQTPTEKTHALLDDLVREDEAVYGSARTLFGSA
tara:strand:- start:283 stop:1239 length:957 start_codon:yes stop_codon:yes gene_type:complete